MSLINVAGLQQLVYDQFVLGGRLQMFLFEGVMPQQAELKSLMVYDTVTDFKFNLSKTIDAFQDLENIKLLCYTAFDYSIGTHADRVGVKVYHNSMIFDMENADTSQTIGVEDGNASFAVLVWTPTNSNPKEAHASGMLVGSFGTVGSGCDFEASTNVVVGAASISFNSMELKFRDADNPATYDTFVALGQTTRQWHGMTGHGNDVYACDGAFVYKQTNGEGDFVETAFPNLDWRDLTSSNGKLYGCAYNDSIYVMDTELFSVQQQGGPTEAQWVGMAEDNGDVYACAYQGLIHKQTAGEGSFIPIHTQVRDWGSMAVKNGVVYGVNTSYPMVFDEDISDFAVISGFPTTIYYNDIEASPDGFYIVCNNGNSYRGLWKATLEDPKTFTRLGDLPTQNCHSIALTKHGLYVGTHADIWLSEGTPT